MAVHPWRPLPPASSGFTLVELLITAVFGAVVIGSVAQYQISQMRSDATQELNLQLREEANRAALARLWSAREEDAEARSAFLALQLAGVACWAV